MKPLNIFRSFTVRLALIYIALFSLSVILLFGFIYGFATRYVDNQIDAAIEAQFNRLYYTYQNDGSRELEDVISELVKSDEEGTEIYLLTNREGERLAGNLEAWPKYGVALDRPKERGRWMSFIIEGTRNYPQPIRVRAITYKLSKWRNLLVGESLLDKRKVQQIIIQTFWASLVVTIFMAIIGAMLMAKIIGHRLNVINRSARTIMEGDITARIPRSGARDQFDVLSANLNNMLDKIEILLKSLSEFSNNIAHDLRTPLNRIIARTEAGLRGMKESSAARKLLESNVAEMEEMISTFNAILKISELESGGDEHDFQPCKLANIADDMIDLYEPLATEKSQAIISKLDRDIVLKAEPRLIAQALANLLDNAIKFSPANTNITVELYEQGEQAILSVADQGAGIPEEARSKVFDKFVRLEESRSEKGNGLGLSLVAAIARIHRAEITLEDAKPGLKVILTFNQDS